MALWGSLTRTERAVPIELRFVDMFLAALGALLFLSMLFVWLISGLGPSVVQKALPEAQVEPLQVLTKSLPAGRAEVFYSLALAYRGGHGRVIWVLDGDLPSGLSFEPATGAITGTPTRTTISRFVVTAISPASAALAEQKVTQPLELTIEPPPPHPSDWVKWFLAVVLAVLVVLWARQTLGHRRGRQLIRALLQMEASGQRSVSIPGGGGLEQRIDFNEGGIGTLSQRFREEARKTRWLLAFILLYCIGYALYLVFWRG